MGARCEEYWAVPVNINTAPSTTCNLSNRDEMWKQNEEKKREAGPVMGREGGASRRAMMQ